MSDSTRVLKGENKSERNQRIHLFFFVPLVVVLNSLCSNAVSTAIVDLW